MPDPAVTQTATQFMEQILIWIGFGTLVGLLAKAIMPGRDPGGVIATLAMGIGGSVIGCAVLVYATGGDRISPISPVGFVVGIAGAFVILFFYRMLSGYFFVEGTTGRRSDYSDSAPPPPRRRRMRRPAREYYVEE